MFSQSNFNDQHTLLTIFKKNKTQMNLLESCRNLISFVATFLLAKKALIIDCTLTIFFTCVSYNLKMKKKKKPSSVPTNHLIN